MLIIGKNFSSRNGAGYYSWHQCGSHEDTHQGVWYEGDEEDFLDRPLPKFTYWEEKTPVCDRYCKSAVILVTGCPIDKDFYQSSLDNCDIVYVVEYDPEYFYGGEGASSCLEMYGADAFKYVK